MEWDERRDNWRDRPWAGSLIRQDENCRCCVLFYYSGVIEIGAGAMYLAA
jgi:hypothetical protein